MASSLPIRPLFAAKVIRQAAYSSKSRLGVPSLICPHAKAGSLL